MIRLASRCQTAGYHFIFTIVLCFFAYSATVVAQPAATTENTRLVFEFSDFNDIKLNGNFVLTLVQDTEYNIWFEGALEDMNRLKAKQKGDKLKISTKRSGFWGLVGSNITQPIVAYISAPALSKIELQSLVDADLGTWLLADSMAVAEELVVAEATTKLADAAKELNKLVIDIEGVCNARAQVVSPAIEVNITGASVLELQGSTQFLEADVCGAAILKAHDLNAQNASVAVYEAANAYVQASKRLAASAKNAATLRYNGNAVVSKELKHMGSIAVAQGFPKY